MARRSLADDEGVMRETLGYDEDRIAALAEKGAFGLRKAAPRN